LEVPASLVGLEGLTLNGMAFSLFDGKATWDRAGKGVSKKYYDAGGVRVAMQQGTTKYWLLGDHPSMNSGQAWAVRVTPSTGPQKPASCVTEPLA
jgi:hypothetical protein